MDELTLLRDAHHVEPPDSDIVQRERAKLTALIHPPTVPHKPTPQHTRRRRHARGPILVGTLAIGVLAGVGAVAARGLLDDNVKEIVQSQDCNITTDDAHLVASATDTRGDTIELWTLDADQGFGDLVVATQPDGSFGGSTFNCDAQTRSSALANRPYASAPSFTIDNEATYIRLFGWVPQPATTARVTLNDGTIITTAVGADGYFLHLITTEPNAGIGVTHIQTMAADGTVVTERDLP